MAHMIQLHIGKLIEAQTGTSLPFRLFQKSGGLPAAAGWPGGFCYDHR